MDLNLFENIVLLLKKYKQWNDLAEQASLNEVYLYWKDKSSRLGCVPIETVNRAIQEGYADKQKRAKRYMLASHKAKSLLEQICDCCSNAEIENRIVEKLFPEPEGEFFDELIAVLKVLGRPFLTFRRETKKTVFHLMLTMIEQLLDESRPRGDSKLQVILCKLWDNPAERTKLMIILINRLTELESNYIIRKKTMKRLLDYAHSHFTEEQQEEKENFKNNYLNRIKQLVGQGNDFAKGLFLEYLLLYNKEYNGSYTFDIPIESLIEKDDTVTFKRKVYLENTKLINYGIEALTWNFESDDQLKKENLIKALKENYYLDNFVQYQTFHKMIKVDDKGEVTEFVSEDNAQKLGAMVCFQMLYNEVFQEPEKLEAGTAEYNERQIQNSEEKLKNILVFRNKTWKLLNLSSSTLLRNWTDNLYYKQQMLKDKATSHSKCHSLHKVLEKVSQKKCDPENENELFSDYFNMIVNSLIGYVNAQVLGGRGSDFFEATGARLRNLKGDSEIYKAMCQMWDLEFDIADGLAECEIRKGTEIVRKIPDLNAVRVLFLAVFQNVTKHGKKNDKGKFLIRVYREGDRLCIANEVENNEVDAARISISPDKYRRGSGISQAVIFDLCHSWYSDTVFTELFKMEQIKLEISGVI